MPLDDRMRQALDRTGENLEPSVEAHLEATIRRASRPGPLPLGGLVAAAVAVLVVVVGGFYLLPSIGQLGGPAASASPSVTPGADFGRIAGRYQVILNATDPGVAELGVAGEWALSLGPTGRLDITPPPTFEGSRASGHSFSLDGPTFRTDLYYNDYCTSLGAFEWVPTPDGLAFETIDDPCEIRRTLLSTHPWKVAE